MPGLPSASASAPPQRGHAIQPASIGSITPLYPHSHRTSLGPSSRVALHQRATLSSGRRVPRPSLPRTVVSLPSPIIRARVEQLLDRYEELWRRFRQRDRVEPTLGGWRGRHRRAALVVKVNDPTLFRRLDRIRHALAGLRFVVPVPDHGLYIPLVELGPVAMRGARAGELLRGRLPDRAAAIQALVTRTAPIGVDVNRVNACSTEVFAELHRSAPLIA